MCIRDRITFEEFGRMQFAVGEIIACEAVPKSRKLLCSQVRIGDQVRQIVSGIKAYYTPEAVSYTHLDVYKRQHKEGLPRISAAAPYFKGRRADFSIGI